MIATENGLFVCLRQGQQWQVETQGLTGQQVTSVIAREGVILAGTRDGIYRSDDLGRSWQPASDGLTIRYIRWLAYHPDISDREFAGTEPAGLFVSQDGAASWRACPEVEALRDENGWFLPYSPEAGCVRGFAFHGERAYAAVEVGGLLRSDDSGQTWRLADGSSGDPDFGKPVPPGFIHSDVHSVEVHPTSPDHVFGVTNSGLYRSKNGGETWDHLYGNIYCRALWLDSKDPDHLILGPADNVDRGGRIEETHDGGQTWQSASTGLNTPWPHHMVERFTQVDDELLAVLSNGELFTSPLTKLHWRRLLPEINGVAAVAQMGE
jgi:photosystem II stability/assembly factor-like uncharacterized protein